MTWLAWVLFFSISFFGSAAAGPVFFGTLTPDIAAAVLVLGAALQRFRQAFWFAVFAGISYDVVAFHSSISFTLAVFLVFLTVRAVLAVTAWEDPMRRVIAVAVGSVAWPSAFAASSAISPVFLRLPPASFSWPAVGSPAFLASVFFSTAWVLLFAWVSVVRFRSRQRARLERI